ncbi:leishmanolysin-related zinc metalloendopeptidase [Marimonas lutisalis]|uniref:leishmanolysin-related zinc metalloendopeptidase n=1 Tax=Marimonas lutisalis TaxID=2545756 RepID=UPI001961F865|nr:leishmanolysin-related zinc metalloendopeptidase [Marimonas lutisalis]
MSEKVSVIGPPDFLADFLSELLPPQAAAELPDASLPPIPETDAFIWDTTSDLDAINDGDGHLEYTHDEESGSHDHTHDHGLVGSQTGNGMAQVSLPSAGLVFSGVFVENDGFSLARPGSDTDTGGGGGGKGSKPAPDDGGGETDGLLSSYTSGGPSKTSYNITINFDTGAWSTVLQQVFIDAADYLSRLVLGDLSDERVPLYGRVDDLAIDASIIEIDGEGGVLGGAAVFASRVGSELPAASIMQFDVADIDKALVDGYLTHVVVHEMVHAMGFGGKWVDMGLVQTFTELDENGVEQDVLRFTGENATAEYKELAVSADDPYRDNGVLVEMDGGPGTEFVHWDDTTFGDLLMTGFIDTSNPGPAVLSAMSIAALEDMGYDTIYEPGMDMLLV